MAKSGDVKVQTSYADVFAASEWLVRYVQRASPRRTVLTGEPDMGAWHTHRLMLSALASDLAIRADRHPSGGDFTLVKSRALLLEFQKAYAPGKFAGAVTPAGLSTWSDRFASAVDRALGARTGRPSLSHIDRKKRLIDPAPCFAVGERQQKRLRRQERIEAQRLQDALSRKITVLTGLDVAKFS